MKIICFDLGGTNFSQAVIEFKNRQPVFLEFQTNPRPKEAEMIKEVLKSYCQEQEQKYQTEKVAISTAKIVDPQRKTVSSAQAYYGQAVFKFSFLEQAGFEIKVENDGRCFGLGEYYFGKGQGAKSLLSLTVGTEIGGGFISQGKIWQGAHYSALEVSYLKDFSGNSWGKRASGKGIEFYYQKFSGKQKRAEEIFRQFYRQDKLAIKAIQKTGQNLSIGLASLINIFDPEKIVIGGGLSQQEDFIKKAIKQSWQYIFNQEADYQFEISELNRCANLLGAASLFLNFSQKNKLAVSVK